LSTAYEGDWDCVKNMASVMPYPFELSTAYEGDWDFSSASFTRRFLVWIEHRLWRWLRPSWGSISIAAMCLNWAPLMKVIETFSGHIIPIKTRVWIEHRLWRWLRRINGDDLISHFLFELSTAYEGDWDRYNLDT